MPHELNLRMKIALRDIGYVEVANKLWVHTKYTMDGEDDSYWLPEVVVMNVVDFVVTAVNSICVKVLEAGQFGCRYLYITVPLASYFNLK